MTSVQRLIDHNHKLAEIKNYTLDQFIAFLDAAERADAVSRTVFITDMSLVISGMFSGGDAMKEHLDSLTSEANGE